MNTVKLRRLTRFGVAACALLSSVAGASIIERPEDPQRDPYVVMAYNNLGMHCMNSDFSQLLILPPYNTLHAQVIRRGEEPTILESGVTVSYEFPSNTHATDKTNFWEHAPALFGVTLPADVGLTGLGMFGVLTRDSVRNDYVAEGIPITPIDDDGRENPYPFALVTVKSSSTGAILAQTQAVVPISWEISCNLCHTNPGESVATSILKSHDRLHGTQLINQQPVLCAACHADNALGTIGQQGVPSMSSAMHLAHAPRMGQANLENSCYACHPGVRTNCQRDVHAARGVTCTACHGDMAAVGDPNRNPWLEEPSCAGCHQRAEFEFEQPGQLFRNSTGHGGVQCMTCHGSPHAIGPAVTATDNAQAMRLQGHTGPLNDCLVCHTSQPTQPFEHKR
ncbi:hypothetical protein GPROT1_01414 [Gammaproteobacteria bacterium]|nr:hypothetical protein GPROT1_01414 [Gammaproteobacteria bacterium]